MRVYDKPIIIEYKNSEEKQWMIYQVVHAYINTTKSNEYANSGSARTTYGLTFHVRYNPGLKQIAHALQDYRILYDGQRYNLKAYDDYQLRHAEVKLVGESRG